MGEARSKHARRKRCALDAGPLGPALSAALRGIGQTVYTVLTPYPPVMLNTPSV